MKITVSFNLTSTLLVVLLLFLLIFFSEIHLIKTLNPVKRLLQSGLSFAYQCYKVDWDD